jgi:outer membrane biosynthesis protein TonB
LVICLVVLGIAGWHWRTQLHAYVTAKLAQEPSNNPAEAPAPPEAPVSVPAASAPVSEVAPAGPNGSAAVEKPVTGGDLAANPSQNSAPPAPQAATLPPPSPQPEAAAAAKPEQTVDNPPPSAKQEAPTTPSQISKSTQPQAPRTTSLRNTGDQLEADGERYLYGTGGAAPDCSRALKDLTGAAGQGSAKAYSVLGTIYATGHCTDRDLPLAYHWFAKALQQDPGNTRLQRDLQVLWNQMSDDERQIAMRTRR